MKLTLSIIIFTFSLQLFASDKCPLFFDIQNNLKQTEKELIHEQLMKELALKNYIQVLGLDKAKVLVSLKTKPFKKNNSFIYSIKMSVDSLIHESSQNFEVESAQLGNGAAQILKELPYCVL